MLRAVPPLGQGAPAPLSGAVPSHLLHWRVQDRQMTPGSSPQPGDGSQPLRDGPRGEHEPQGDLVGSPPHP